MQLKRNFAAWLRGIMDSRRPPLTQSQVAAYTGVSQATVNDLLLGKKRPRPDTIRRLCDGLGVPYEEGLAAADYINLAPLPARETPPSYDLPSAVATIERILTDFVEVPMGEISAGPGVWTEDVFQLPRTVVESRRNVIGFQVHGGSMQPLVNDGDYVFVDQDKSPEPGDIVAAWKRDGGAVVKTLAHENGHLVLKSNGGPAIPVNEDITIEGVVFFVGKFVRR